MKTRRAFAPVVLAAAFVLLPATSRAGDGEQIWVQVFRGPYSGVWSRDLAVDHNGNVIVTGAAYNTSGSPYTYYYATVKYSSAGLPLWTNYYIGPTNYDEPYAIAIDANDNEIVTGRSKGTYRSRYNCATVKYSSSGVPVWTNRFARDPMDAVAVAIALDTNGNTCVAGASYDSHGWLDFVTLRYSNSGVPTWTNLYSRNVWSSNPGYTNTDDRANAIKVDAQGNAYVTGYSEGGGSREFATIKYSSNGLLLWANFYGGPADYSEARALDLDASGNVYVTGLSANNYNVQPYNYDYATIKYSSSGLPLWTNRYNGPDGGSDVPVGLVVDALGDVYVTGSSARTNAASYNSDYLTIKYSSAGVPLWTNRYNGEANNNDTPSRIAIDGRGNVYVTGTSSNGTDTDYLTIAYSSVGVSLWTNRYNGPGNSSDAAQSIAVDAAGNVYVTGSSGTDMATIKYAAVTLAPPVITNAVLAGTSLVFGGNGGSGGGIYYVLTSTNVIARMTNWVRVATNKFDAAGGFTVTNAVDPGRLGQFFQLEVP